MTMSPRLSSAKSISQSRVNDRTSLVGGQPLLRCYIHSELARIVQAKSQRSSEHLDCQFLGSRFMSASKIQPNEDQVISTGIAGLDNVLNGGFPRGHFFLVQGEPGAGKTTLGLQFLMAGTGNGESVLYVTMSESEREIRKIARSHLWSLDGITIYEFVPTEDSLRPEDQ